MRVLAIDTALEACSVGVADGTRVVMRSEIAGRDHAERLPDMIAAVLAEAGLEPRDLDRIAVTVGPGSFTGVRIGIAAARGIALVTGAETVGISTLAVHAEAARIAGGPREVLAVIAAGRGELYGALFSADGDERETAHAGSAQVFAAMVGPDTVIAGSGADLVVAALPMDVPRAVAHRDASPSIVALCALAVRAAKPDGPARPLYLRPPDAKPQSSARVTRQ